jgi:histidinol-phosphate phosphatase family protein
MNKAVFLDRDGVINREVDVLRSLKQLRLLPRVAQAVRQLNKLGFLIIVVTNQPVIARGWLTKKGLEKIHQVLIERLAKKGARIDAIYYCPHHPNANLKKYRRRCQCRKPNIGLIKKAVKKFKINVKESFMVGDGTGDILAGQRAGLKTILVETGYAGKDGKYDIKPDFIIKNLNEAIKIIKNKCLKKLPKP